MLRNGTKASSRQQIDIKGVRDNVLILPHNRYRAILKTSSVNFELKSEAEQDALIDTYRAFLNSLAGPIQIVVRVREMDMDKYLDDFQHKKHEEKEAIYRSQMENYTEFVQSLIKDNKILTRSFYIVVPYIAKSKDEFDTIKEQLNLSCDIVSKGLSRLGMHSSRLNDLEVLDLFYSFYNPRLAKRQPLKERTLQMLKESYV